MDYLVEKKKESKREYTFAALDEEAIRNREELSEQIQSLEDLKVMALKYDCDFAVGNRY